MRFLKNKILRAQSALKNLPFTSMSAPVDIGAKELAISELEGQRELNEKSLAQVENQSKQLSYIVKNNLDTKKEDASLKNIAVNYGRAITSFASSPLAVPYIQNRLKNEDLKIKEFINFINREKNHIGGICSFRERLLVGENDESKIATCKKVFQWIAEIFIKYFSVNWIIHGRVTHKETYLKFRFRMLRRVRNPESFTYIKQRAINKN